MSVPKQEGETTEPAGSAPAGRETRNTRLAIENKSEFSDDQVEAILATAARLLVREQHVAAASILANEPTANGY